MTSKLDKYDNEIQDLTVKDESKSYSMHEQTDLRALKNGKVFGSLAGVEYHQTKQEDSIKITGSLSFVQWDFHEHYDDEEFFKEKFDIVLAAANEYGVLFLMKIKGVLLDLDGKWITEGDPFKFTADTIEPWAAAVGNSKIGWIE